MKSWEITVYTWVMKNQYSVQKKSNREKVQSLLNDGNQLRGAEKIKCREGYHWR